MSRYHLPSKIKEHIDYITPGIRLIGGRWGGKSKLRKRAADGSKTTGLLRAHHTPPRPLPVNVETLAASVQASPLANCDRYITSDCLKGIFLML
jgi:tripeptidyl-peptidase I